MGGILGESQHKEDENMNCLGKSPVLDTVLNTSHTVSFLILTTVLSGMYIINWGQLTCQKSHSQQIEKQDSNLGLPLGELYS